MSTLTCPHCNHPIEIVARPTRAAVASIPVIVSWPADPPGGALGPETLRTPSLHVPPSRVPVVAGMPPLFGSIRPTSIRATNPSPSISARPLPLGANREISVPVPLLRSIKPGAVISVRPDPQWRADVELDVTPESEHNFFVGFSANVSEGGIFVATYALKPVGSKLHVRFTLPGDTRPIDALTEVRWVRDHNDASDVDPGLGLQFIEISASAKARIHEFCARARAPLFFPD